MFHIWFNVLNYVIQNSKLMKNFQFGIFIHLHYSLMLLWGKWSKEEGEIVDKL